MVLLISPQTLSWSCALGLKWDICILTYFACFCHPWENHASSFLAQWKVESHHLSLSFALETVCWNKAATRFWSYGNITQMGASLLVTATLMSTEWLSSVTIRGQVRIGYTSRKQATTCSLGLFIIFRWGCQPLGTLKQQACGDQSHGGCPVVWDFQWSGLADM